MCTANTRLAATTASRATASAHGTGGSTRTGWSRWGWASSRNAASPATQSRQPTTTTRSTRWFHRSQAEDTAANRMPRAISGCTRVSGPNASAVSCRARPTTTASRPSTQSGWRTRCTNSRGFSGAVVRTRVVPSCCSALPTPKLAAPPTAAGTARRSGLPLDPATVTSPRPVQRDRTGRRGRSGRSGRTGRTGRRRWRRARRRGSRRSRRWRGAPPRRHREHRRHPRARHPVVPPRSRHHRHDQVEEPPTADQPDQSGLQPCGEQSLCPQ